MLTRQKQRAFSLIELLVVVAIIVVLIAILLPSLNRARQQSKRLMCLSNLRQHSIASMNYCTDFDGYFLPAAPLFDKVNSKITTWAEDPTTRQFLELQPYVTVYYAEARANRICPNADWVRGQSPFPPAAPYLAGGPNPNGSMSIRGSYGMNYSEFMDPSFTDLWLYSASTNPPPPMWVAYRVSRMKSNGANKMQWACSLAPMIRVASSFNYVGELYPSPNDQIAYRHGPGSFLATKNTLSPNMTVGYTGTNIAFYDGHAEAVERKLVDSTFLTQAQIDMLWYAYK